LQLFDIFEGTDPVIKEATLRLKYVYQLLSEETDWPRSLNGKQLESCLQNIWEKIKLLQSTPGMTARTCSIELEDDENALKTALQAVNIKDMIRAMDLLAFYRSSCPAIIEPMVNRLFANGIIDLEVYIECH